MGFKKRKNGGFTLVEMLGAAAVLMVLMTFGFVEIVKHSRQLKVTEMDNMARSIYLAAENRAVTLARSGQLTADSITAPASDGSEGGKSLAASGSTSNLYYIKSPSAKLDDLIPVGTIEPTLREASFYIVYDIAAGCVRDVFYDAKTSGENFTAAFSASAFGAGGNFALFYEKWNEPTTDTSCGMRADNKIYIGHYGGEATAPPPNAESTSDPPKELKPEITIINGEKLELSVKYATKTEINGWKLEVKLTYGKQTVTLPLNEGVQLPNSNTWTYTLDALGGPYFKDLVWKKKDGNYMTDPEKDAAEVRSLGGMFEVTATIVEDPGFTGDRANLIATPAIARQANSLFADASANGGTAIIANLRHLQNLNKTFSGVLNKTDALQIADIEADKLKDNNGNLIKEGYQFLPINNDQLKSYKSTWNGTEAYYSIKNLTVNVANMSTIPGAGLFAKAEGTSSTEPFKFQNVWLINAAVNGGGKPTGSIVGTATNANFEGCRVYWTDTAKLEKNGKVEYKILSNSAAGGLVGNLSGGNISMSFAATTIQGNASIGGLIGTAKDVTINKAYADCYLQGESAGLKAGGLIGSASGNTELTNVYSSGFIEWTKTTEDSAVAGFCAAGSVTATNAYSGVYYQATGGYANTLSGSNAKAWADGVSGADDKCYAAWGYNSNKGYEGLKDLISTLGSEFESKNNAQNSSPYRLGKNSGLGNYEVPGIKGLPHYGDWANGNQGGLPIVWVVNGEELLAKIQTTGGGVAADTTPNESSFTKPHVKLCYGDKEVEIPAGSVKYENYKCVSSTESEVLWGVTLDSLNGPHFKDWWTDPNSSLSSFGGDFSVIASTGGSTWTKASAKSSGNSLFASGTVTMKDDKPVSISSDKIAYIENLRHLQNLDAALSGVDGKTEAVQTADIIYDKPYDFKPITNNSLQKYTVREKTDSSSGAVSRGEYCEISGLKVTAESSKDKAGAGLFASVSSTGSDEKLHPFQFKNVSLKGANITSDSATIPAGALAGTTSGTVEFTNCKITGNSVVKGKGSAGGLVGKATGIVIFQSCTGSQITVNADGQADARGFGGLAGYVDGSIQMTNCQINGATVKNASVTTNDGLVTADATEGGFRDCVGGLVGYVKSDATFTDCSVGLSSMVNVWGADCQSTASNSTQSQIVFVGGMAGYVGGSFLATNCMVVQATLRGTGNRSAVGGLTGFTKSAEITGCIIGDVIGQAGAVAIDSSSNYPYPDYTVEKDSYNKLSEQAGSGGMIGYAMSNVSLSGCKVVGKISVKGYKTADHVGGFVGYAYKVTGEMLAGCEVKKSEKGTPTIESGAGGSTVGAGHAGGMVGFAQPNITLTDCKADSITVQKNKNNVAGLRGVGGLVGFVGTMRYTENDVELIKADGKATLTRCSTIGSTSVTSTGFRNRVGGLVGYATAADFKGCEVVGSSTDKVSVQGLFEALQDSDKIKNKYENVDKTIFVGGMIGSSASNNDGGIATTFDEDENKNVCKIINTKVYGKGPRACVGGMMGLADQTTFANCIVGMEGDAPSVTVSAASENTNSDLQNNTGGIGGIAGYANNKIVFTDCTVINAKVGEDIAADYNNMDKFDVGGILGSTHQSGMFTRCTVGVNDATKKVTINGTRFVGGIVGFVVKEGQFTDCKVNQAAVSSVHISESAAGGVLGKGTGNTSMSKCTVSNTMVNAQNTGGSTSGTTSKKACAGGLAGELIGKENNRIEVKINNECTVTSVTTKATSVGTGLNKEGEQIGYQEYTDTK